MTDEGPWWEYCDESTQSRRDLARLLREYCQAWDRVEDPPSVTEVRREIKAAMVVAALASDITAIRVAAEAYQAIVDEQLSLMAEVSEAAANDIGDEANRRVYADWFLRNILEIAAKYHAKERARRWRESEALGVLSQTIGFALTGVRPRVGPLASPTASAEFPDLLGPER